MYLHIVVLQYLGICLCGISDVLFTSKLSVPHNTLDLAVGRQLSVHTLRIGIACVRSFSSFRTIVVYVSVSLLVCNRYLGPFIFAL